MFLKFYKILFNFYYIYIYNDNSIFDIKHSVFYRKNNFYNFSHVTIESNSLAEMTNDAIVDFTVLKQDVISDLNLQLTVGRLENDGAFNPVTGNITIGENILVKLHHIATADFK